MPKNYPHVPNAHTGNLSLLPKRRLPKAGVRAWVTRDDRSRLCERVRLAAIQPTHPNSTINNILVLDPDVRRQEILGFGGTMIDSDVYNLQRLTPGRRRRALDDLMGESGLGFRLMRIAFGSTDWNRDWDFYSYCDRPAGETDPTLEHFSIQKDIDRGTIDVLREMLAANPETKILASVWGLPAWMKTNDSLIGGFFDSRWMDVYAEYLVKCVQAYEAAGIPVHYITTQNEPGTAGDRDTPATMWTWEQQRDITLALAKRLRARRLKTKIWLHDHNFDMAMNYVRPMLQDPAVRRAAAGVAWHDYKGRPDDMALLHSLYPKIPAILTERNRGGLADMARLIEILRCGAQGHISWTTVTCERGGPHQYERGYRQNKPVPDVERAGHILVVPEDSAARVVKPTVFYYYRQLSPKLAPGARRILSNNFRETTIASAAFANPDGSLVFVAANAGDEDTDFALQVDHAALPLRIEARSMLTVQLPGAK